MHCKGTGWNRFEKFTQYKTVARKGRPTSYNAIKESTLKNQQLDSITAVLKTEKEHPFLYDVTASRLYPYAPSLQIDYSNNQGTFSLWKGMKDEVRLLPKISSEEEGNIAKKNNQYDILIGLGSLSWSGGIYNCSPFCLYRKRR
jgi:hypothetical protein